MEKEFRYSELDSISMARVPTSVQEKIQQNIDLLERTPEAASYYLDLINKEIARGREAYFQRRGEFPEEVAGGYSGQDGGGHTELDEIAAQAAIKFLADPEKVAGRIKTIERDAASRQPSASR